MRMHSFRSSQRARRAPPATRDTAHHGAAALLAVLLACTPTPAPVQQAAPADVEVTQSTLPPAEALAQLARETDGKLRQPLYRAIRNAPAETALPALRAALADPDPTLLAVAAQAASRRDDGATLAPELIANLTHADPAVRAWTARSLGALRVGDAIDALRRNLGHDHPETRVSALRAIARIDMTAASALPELAALQLDPDARVASVATKISRGIAPIWAGP